MTPEQHRAISAKGGKRAHALGRAHTWNTQTGQDAGFKSAQVRRKRVQANATHV